MGNLLGAPISLLVVALICAMAAFLLKQWEFRLSSATSALKFAFAAALKLLSGSLGWASLGFCVFWILIALSEQGVGVLPDTLVGRLLDLAREVHGEALSIAGKLKLAEFCLVMLAAIALVVGFTMITSKNMVMPKWMSLVLANKGVWNTLSMAKRTLGVVLPLLVGATMLASDIGICSGDSCIEHSLGRIRLTLEAQAAEQRFAELQGSLPPEPSPSETGSHNNHASGSVSDCRTANIASDNDSLCIALTRVFERVVRDSYAGREPSAHSNREPDHPPPSPPQGGANPNGGNGGPPGSHSPSPPTADELAARDAILKAFADNHTTVTPPGEGRFGLAENDAEIMSALESAVTESAPRSVAGADMAERLPPILAAVGPDGRAHLRRAVAVWLRSFGAVQDTSTLDREIAKWGIGYVLERATDVNLGPVDLTPIGPGPKLAKKAAAKFAEEGGLHFYTAVRDRFLSHILLVARSGIATPPPDLQGPALPGVEQAFQSARNQFASLGTLATKAASDPPELWERTRETTLAALRRELSSLRASEPADDNRLATEKRLVALAATYQDNFPGRPEDPGPTAIGQFSPDWTPPNGGGAAGQLAERQRLSKLTRNYNAMSKYDHVGGVVIGRKPSVGSDIRRITWDIDQARKVIILHVIWGDGATRDLGPFDADLTLRSLVYAADGRTVAATVMAIDDNFPEGTKRIMLHPALQGSQIGKAIYDIDKWVFDVPLGEKELADKSAISEFNAATAWMSLYGNWNRTSQNTLQAAKASSPPWQLTSAPLPSAISDHQLKDLLPVCVRDPKVTDAVGLRKCLVARAFSRLTKEQITTCRKEFYPTNKEKCFKDFIVKSILPSIPKYTTVSGVRQGSDKIRPESSDPLWPFKFVVQFSFGLPSADGPTNGKAEEPEALILTYLEPAVEAKLQTHVRQDENAAHVRDIVRRFTILQQVFRDGLASPAPIPGRLTQLADALAPFRHTEYEIPLWDGRSASELLSGILRNVDRIMTDSDMVGESPPAIFSSFATCAESKADSKDAASFTWSAFAKSCQPEEIQTAWNKICVTGSEKTFSGPCGGAKLFHEFMVHLQLLSVRAALQMAAAPGHGLN